ncbi:MAG: hypothetical protein KTR25_00265 [Myxococcales bacterium]|nr:hypothetical protein [Myxococcales bacterium]
MPTSNVYGLLFVMLASACGDDESLARRGWAERESGVDSFGEWASVYVSGVEH